MCALFSGHIAGTPIIIDNFNAPVISTAITDPLIYILTHAHTDHMRGLSDTFRRGPIFCSEATRALLITMFPSLMTVTTALPLDIPHNLTLSTSVTFVDANHC